MSPTSMSVRSRKELQTCTSTNITDDSDDISWTQVPSVGETIVKLRGGNGPPLIVIHGGGGTIHAFAPLKKNFSSTLWAIQVTPDTPLHTLQAQTEFYYKAIKAEQPTGPYRICSFSASSMIAVALVQLLEKNGDTVAQLAFIDHFPTTFVAPIIGVDISQLRLDDPRVWQAFLDASVNNLLAMTHRDGKGNNPKRHKMADDLRAAYHGLPTSAFIENFKSIVDRFLNQAFDFIVSLHRDALKEGGQEQCGMSFLENWLRSVKAPVSAYLGTYGMLGSLTAEHHPPAEWYDLRIHRSFPNAKITVLDAGHYDILGNAGLIRGLQEGYIVERTRL